MTVFVKPTPIPYESPTIQIGGGTSLVKSIASAIAIPDSQQEDAIGKSYLGTPVIDNLEFPQGSYIDLQGNVIDYGAVVIDTVTFEVNRVKKIIETDIQGRDNSVFEYVTNTNYEITCNGVLSVKDNIFPLDLSRSLQKIFDIPQQVPVVSAFLNDVFEIFNIVIRRHNISQRPGTRNSIPFSFIASQDVDLDVKELE